MGGGRQEAAKTFDADPLRAAWAELQYAAFNATRSLKAPTHHRAEVSRSAEGLRIRCAQVPTSCYLNRVVAPKPPDPLPGGTVQWDCVQDEPYGATLRIVGRVPPVRSVTDPRVVRYGPDRGQEFLRLIEATMGQSLPAGVLAAKSPLYCTDAFRCFVAEQHGHALGIATLFAHNGVGWLANAFTFRPVRRQGIHAALIAARLADAQQLGLEQVYVDVEPGSDSERNVLRAGFVHCTYYTSRSVAAEPLRSPQQ